jgi:hypothetical protein
MLIVGGGAALTAIAVYLGWYFLKTWRDSLRQRRAREMAAIADRGGEAQRVRDARELHLVP